MKCKNCGAEISVKNGGGLDRHAATAVECPYCRSENRVEKWSEVVDGLLNKALTFRLAHQYDIAYEAYDKAIKNKPDCTDALWGALLSKYGVEISKRTNYKPSLHKISKESFIREPNYTKLTTGDICDDNASLEYIKKGKEIEAVRINALKAVEREPDYDIFLSFKTTEDNEEKSFTPDKELAEKIYNKLSKRYRVFYAPVTLKGKSGLAYEPIIYAALNSAEAMVLIASKEEYINSPWVANEWKRFVEIMETNTLSSSERELSLLVCHYGDLVREKLPDALQSYQTVNLDEDGAFNTLIESIEQSGNIKASFKEMRDAEKASDKADKQVKREASAYRRNVAIKGFFKLLGSACLIALPWLIPLGVYMLLIA